MIINFEFLAQSESMEDAANGTIDNPEDDDDDDEEAVDMEAFEESGMLETDQVKLT